MLEPAEKSQPKYALLERERRWLVDPANRPELGDTPYNLIEDRYLRGSRLRLRRVTDGATGLITLKLTKKYASLDALARPIVTAYLESPEYELFAALPADVVAKRRFPIFCGSLKFSLDVFHGDLEGLEILEIECPDVEQLNAVKPPQWVINEISCRPEFEGGTLAAVGQPEWIKPH